MINKVIILNTLADNSADFVVNAAGELFITGADETINVTSTSTTIKPTPAVAETSGVVTFTTTGTIVSGATYSVTLTGNTATNGDSQSNIRTFSVTATSTDTFTTLFDKFRTDINAEIVNLQITATGTTTLICTGRAGYPIVFGSTTSSQFTATQTTTGVNAIGLGSQLLLDNTYDIGTASTFGTFTPAASYTRVNISYRVVSEPFQARTDTQAQENIVLFINEAATSSGSDNAVVNRALLLNTSYGSIYLTRAGYRAVVTEGQSTTSAITTGAAITLAAAATSTSTGSIAGTTMTITTQTTALVVKGMVISGTGVTANTVVLGQLTGEMGGVGTYLVDRSSSATGSQTLTGTSATALNTATLGLQSGDFLVVNTVAALTASTNPFATITNTKVTGVTTLTAGFGTGVTAAAAAIALFKHIAVRNLPRG
jgi:hypothetical protein